MKIINTFCLVAITLVLFASACIKDDFVDDFVEPTLKITNPIDSIAKDSLYQFEVMYLNNIGIKEQVNANWNSSNTSVLSIDQNGLANAIMLGSSTISVEYDNGTNLLKDSINVGVGLSTSVPNPMVKSGMVNSTSSYTLTGSFELKENGNDLILEFASDYVASTSLPGLFIYLTNNPNSTSGAYEIGAVQIFSGAHSYNIPNTGINDHTHVLYFCKPFNVKVGDGEIL